jgi:hypothetical protein
MNTIIFFENAAAFACGSIIAAALTWLVKSKPKYVLFVLLNSLSGGLLQLVFSAFLHTTAFSWFGCGALGIIGFALSLLY